MVSKLPQLQLLRRCRVGGEKEGDAYCLRLIIRAYSSWGRFGISGARNRGGLFLCRAYSPFPFPIVPRLRQRLLMGAPAAITALVPRIRILHAVSLNTPTRHVVRQACRPYRHYLSPGQFLLWVRYVPAYLRWASEQQPTPTMYATAQKEIGDVGRVRSAINLVRQCLPSCDARTLQPCTRLLSLEGRHAMASSTPPVVVA